MLNIPMDVDTVFKVYKITYVCTHAFDPKDKGQEDIITNDYLITGSEDAVHAWFREAFNSHGDIYDLLHVQEVTDFAHFAFEHYKHVGDEREKAELASKIRRRK